MPEYQRIARLLEILSLIRSQRNLAPSDLAEHFGVSRQCIFEDIADLNVAGIPIVFGQRGYEVLPGYFLPPLNLKTEEVLLGLMSMEMLQQQGLVTDPSLLRTFRSKIVDALDERQAEQMRDLGDKLAAPRQSSPERIASELMNTITTAVRENRRLEIRYRSLNSGHVGDREVDPYGLVFLKNSWYLTGFCLKHKEIRTFKLIRIQDAKPLPVQTSPPKNFSPEKYYQGSWGVYSGPLRNVTLHFNRQVAPLIREKQYIDSEMEDRPDGSLILKVKTRGLKEISWWIMQFGEQVEVLSPKTLRKMIASRLKRMSAMYASELEAVDRAIN